MDNRKDYRQDGYCKGFADGKRTGGKINRVYVDNLFHEETKELSHHDSLSFMKGWEEGFADGVIGRINNIIKKEGILKNHIL